MSIKVWRIDTVSGKRKFFNSLIKAGESINSEKSRICSINIGRVVNDNKKTAYGYKWITDDSMTKDLEGEIWKEIPENIIGVKNHYISSLGRYKDNKGYIKDFEEKTKPIRITINNIKHFIHRLVLETFSPYKGDSSRYKVEHIDGNVTNNALINLKWIISREELNKDKVKEYNIREVEEDEEYKEIPGYPNYEASNLGYIRVKETKQNKKFSKDINGYDNVKLTKSGKSTNFFVHQIIAKTFLKNEENKPTVNHKNKIRDDNRAINLEWATQTEQNNHKINFDKENNIEKNKNGNANNVRVVMLDKKTGDEIETFNSIKDAMQSLYECGETTCLESSMISAVLNGKRKSAYGYKWKLADCVTADLEGEIWKEIPENIVNKTNYFVSTLGRFKDNKGYIATFKEGKNYIKITIDDISYRLHRVIMLTFYPNENAGNLVVNHKDGNRRNNYLDNLEWATNSENSKHAYDTGLNKSNKKIIQYALNMNELGRFNSIQDASKELNIHFNTISNICNGITKKPRKFNFRFDNEE